MTKLEKKEVNEIVQSVCADNEYDVGKLIGSNKLSEKIKNQRRIEDMCVENILLGFV